MENEKKNKKLNDFSNLYYKKNSSKDDSRIAYDI